MAGKHLLHDGKKVQKRLRSLFPMAAVLCLLVAVCGGTYSYFSGKDQVVNRLALSGLDFVIEEPSWKDPDTLVRPGDVLPKDPQIVNTGETAFVVRAKIQEIWKPKKPDLTQPTLENPDHVRFFAADKGGTGADGSFTAQQLLDILREDSQKEEGQKNFALRLSLIPNKTNPNPDYWDLLALDGWYRGSSPNSEWLYYNQVVHPAMRTAPVFRAVTIRTAEDVCPLDKVSPGPGETLEQARAKAMEEYNRLLTQYDLDIYVYAEIVQADAFAWKAAWGDDFPQDWTETWGGN